MEGSTKFKGTALEKVHLNAILHRHFLLLLYPDSKGIAIGDSAFYGSSIRGSLSLPKSVTKIGKDAFSNCRSISNTLYLAATNVGRRAFEEKEASAGSDEEGDSEPAVSFCRNWIHRSFDCKTFYNSKSR